MKGDPEDLDTALADYVHFTNALKAARGGLRDAEEAVEVAKDRVHEAGRRQAEARKAIGKFAKVRQ